MAGHGAAREPLTVVATFRFNPPPGWPEPAPGWAPTADWQPHQDWPAAPYGWPFWLEVRARSWWQHPAARVASVVCGLGVLAVTFGIFMGLGITAVEELDPYFADYPRDSPMFAEQMILFGLAWYVCVVALFAVLARQVAFRWFVAFWLLVPVYGQFVMVRILWRCSSLPRRYWRPRPGRELQVGSALGGRRVDRDVEAGDRLDHRAGDVLGAQA